jgi:hypothetical protein
MSTKKRHTLNPRATYFQGYKIPKKIMMWVPPSVEEEYFNSNGAPSIMEFVYFIEASGVERIDTTLYDGSFEHFYSLHIDIDKYNKTETSFCATSSEGGVSTDYIIDSANSDYDDESTITLISVDIDNVGNITDVYALVTFRLINHEPDTIMVETLCGNRSLPPSGEGTRLINYLTDLAYTIGIHKIALHPIDSAIGYYTRLNFVELRKDEADAINDDEGTTTFRKNTRARKNWKKAMHAVRFAINQKKLNEMKQNKIIIKEIHQAKYNEKIKKGIPINKPFSTPQKSYVTKPVGKLVSFQKNPNGDIIKTREVYRITPGNSLRVAKMKSEIKDAAQITKIIMENAKNENAQKKELPTIKEESNSPEQLTQEEIERQAREFRNEEKKNALQHFANVQEQKRPTPAIVPPVEEDNSVYENIEHDVEKEESEFQKNEKTEAVRVLKEERKKRNATVRKTLKKYKNAKGKKTQKRKPNKRRV